MKAFKTIGNISLCFLAILSVLIMVAYGFYNYFVDDITIGVNNISDQIAIDVKSAEDLTEEERLEYEERWFMEANYYSNDKQNGIVLQELNFNYFTTYKLREDDYRSTGMQKTNKDHTSQNTQLDSWKNNANPNSVDHGYYYYDSVDGISFNGTLNAVVGVSTMLTRNTELIIKIDNNPYMVRLNGYYDKPNEWWDWFNLNDENTYYTYGDLFAAVMRAVETNSAGYGDYYLTLDLSKFFSIRAFTEDGKFSKDKVTDIVNNYAVIKFHYDENGASRSSQSLFGQINCSKVFDTEKVDYWQERMVYTLTEEDLVYRYSESYDGYFVSLGPETKKFFDDMPTTKLILDLDFTSVFCENKEFNVVGFDYNAFSGFYIDTLIVKSAPSTLYVKDNSFDDATVKTLKHSADITWDGLTDIGWEVEIL